MHRVLNVGSLNHDHVYRVPRIVAPGETLAGEHYERFAGGKGFNQSIALARAGARVAHAGGVGADGDSLRRALAHEGVEVSRITEVNTPTGHAIIQVNPAGENAIVLFPGANRAFAPAAALRWIEDFGPGDWLLCQNETVAVPELIHAARARGMTVCCNPAPMTPEVRTWPLEHVRWLVVNETEGTGLTGETDPARIVRGLKQAWPATDVILSLGAEGAIATESERVLRVPAPRVQTVDTTAAGDTLIGYFLAELIQGRAVEAALQRACRAAAICVTRRGASASIPTAAEVDQSSRA